MRDGVHIATDVMLPTKQLGGSDTPVPAVFFQTRLPPGPPIPYALGLQ
jgi:predicted acyl esterase